MSIPFFAKKIPEREAFCDSENRALILLFSLFLTTAEGMVFLDTTTVTKASGDNLYLKERCFE